MLWVKSQGNEIWAGVGRASLSKWHLSDRDLILPHSTGNSAQCYATAGLGGRLWAECVADSPWNYHVVNRLHSNIKVKVKKKQINRDLRDDVGFSTWRANGHGAEGPRRGNSTFPAQAWEQQQTCRYIRSPRQNQQQALIRWAGKLQTACGR